MSFSSPTSRAQRSRRFLPWLLYLYALVLFAMHFVRIFDNSFWGDEGFSIGLAQMNVFEMLQVTAADNHPPLYYLFTQLLYHLLGNHGYVYHLSALIPYGLILILACTVIFRQFGLIPAVVVSTFASLTDTAIMFNVEARMYSLGAFFVLAAYLALHNILHSGKTSDWVIFSVASLCAAYTHYYALISVAFFYLALLSLLPQDKSSFKKNPYHLLCRSGRLPSLASGIASHFQTCCGRLVVHLHSFSDQLYRILLQSFLDSSHFRSCIPSLFHSTGQVVL